MFGREHRGPCAAICARTHQDSPDKMSSNMVTPVLGQNCNALDDDSLVINLAAGTADYVFAQDSQTAESRRGVYIADRQSAGTEHFRNGLHIRRPGRTYAHIFYHLFSCLRLFIKALPPSTIRAPDNAACYKSLYSTLCSS